MTTFCVPWHGGYVVPVYVILFFEINVLMFWFQVNTQIEKIDLEGNHIEATGVKHLSKMLRENLYITDLVSMNLKCLNSYLFLTLVMKLYSANEFLKRILKKDMKTFIQVNTNIKYTVHAVYAKYISVLFSLDSPCGCVYRAHF